MTSGQTFLRAGLFSLLVITASCEDRERSEMEEACAHRGRIAKVGDTREATCDSTAFVAATPALEAALAGASPDAVLRAMHSMEASALWVDIDPSTSGQSLLAKLSRAEHVEGFRTRALDRGVMLVEPFTWPLLAERESWALARVARGVLGGTPSPTLSQFPASLRAPAPVEVMVLLRDGGSPIFWRSARGGSIASALLLALGVARTRWEERSSTLRGALPERLPSLDVEVWLLAEDGTYSSRDRGLIDSTLRHEHGVGYEMNDNWQYELPERLGQKRGVRAFEALFAEQHLGERALDRPDLRLYRLIAMRLGVSRAGAAQIAPPPSPRLIHAEGGVSP